MAKINNTVRVRDDKFLTHQNWLSLSGMGFLRGLKEKEVSSAVEDLLWNATAIATTKKSMKSMRPT